MTAVKATGTRTINEAIGLMIDPFDVRTWPEEQQRNHRLRRALHELMIDPRYRVEVGQKPDGTPGVRILTEFGVTDEAAAFLRTYREEFITYLSWIEVMDGYHKVDGEVDFTQRKAA